VNKKLAIIGASGHGKVIAELAEILGFQMTFFDDAYPKATQVEHWSVVGDFNELLSQKSEFCGAVVAIGNAQIRQAITAKLHQADIVTPILIHPTASVSKYAQIKHGSIVMAGAVINAFSSIGQGCIVNSNAVVEHDCQLADFVHICPNSALAGGVIVGERTWVGIGSSIRQLTNVGADVLIGAGSVVVNDISAGVTVVGVPAKVIKD
jgi:sugar O-acyltransferase (sialic acid O-acetyltransferase NeuD family)